MPIETLYNGYKFRSRLEARWAVFFDSLGVEYEYEPEGYYLPANGDRYLPDFKLKCFGTRGTKTEHVPMDLYIEVKGNMTGEDYWKIKDFAGSLSNNEGILIVTEIPSHGYVADSSEFKCYEQMNGMSIYPFNYELIDGDYFGAYPAADAYGHFYLFGDDSSYVNKEDVQRVIDAYDNARQARFEHGETPYTGR